MRSSTDPHLTRAKRVFARNQSRLCTSDAIRLGIHPRTLFALRDDGAIEIVSRGLYRLTSARPLANPDWAFVATKVSNEIICLISALSHHWLTTQVPQAIDIAPSSHSRVPRLEDPPIQIFWFAEPAFSSGVDTVMTDEIEVRVYSAEKSIADCFKYRNKIGLDIAIEALKIYREKWKKPDFKLLLKYAEIDRVQKIIRPYPEAIT